MTKAKMVVVNATELKPGRKYVICVDKNALSIEDLAALASHLKSIGIENAVAVMVDGNPHKLIKIIEQEQSDNGPTHTME